MARSIAHAPCFAAAHAQFAEARDEIECAEEALGSVYFNEEFEVAEEAVTAAVDYYAAMLERLGTEDGDGASGATPPGGQRATVQRSNGLKVEQLKGELQMLRDKALED